MMVRLDNDVHWTMERGGLSLPPQSIWGSLLVSEFRRDYGLDRCTRGAVVGLKGLRERSVGLAANTES